MQARRASPVSQGLRLTGSLIRQAPIVQVRLCGWLAQLHLDHVDAIALNSCRKRRQRQAERAPSARCHAPGDLPAASRPATG